MLSIVVICISIVLLVIIVRFNIVYAYENAVKSIWNNNGETRMLKVNTEDKAFEPTLDYNINNASIIVDAIVRVEKATENNTEPLDPVGFTKEGSYKVNGGNTFAVIWSKGRDVMIALRATNGSWEIKQDLDISHAQFGGSNVHQGFLNVYSEFRNELIEKVSTLTFDRIFVGGHSLGGSIVPLVCSDLRQYNICGYSFGAPRTGDEFFKELVSNLSIYRVYNENDQFVYMPPTVAPNIKNPSSPLKYTHCGTGVSFDLNYGYVQLNHSIVTYSDFINS